MRPYWKPEQPPPCTNTRRPLPALFSSVSSSLILEAAVSDTLIMATLYQQPVDILHRRHMPFVPIAPISRAKFVESAEARWGGVAAARPDLAPAAALQRELLGPVVDAPLALERG